MKKVLLVGLFLSSLLFVPAIVSAGSFDFSNPLVRNASGAQDLSIAAVVGRFVFVLLSIVGALAAFTFIRAGINIGLAAGRPDMVEKGRKGLLWGVVGLAVVFAGFVVVNFILGRIQRINAPVSPPTEDSLPIPERGGAVAVPPGF